MEESLKETDEVQEKPFQTEWTAEAALETPEREKALHRRTSSQRTALIACAVSVLAAGLLLLLTLFPEWFFGPLPEAEPALEFYLVAEHVPLTGGDLQKLRLQEEPFLTAEDIVFYDWEKQAFVTEGTLLAHLWDHGIHSPGEAQGKAFVVAVGGERIYMGKFWSSISSSYRPGVVIDVYGMPYGLQGEKLPENQYLYMCKGADTEDAQAGKRVFDRRIYEALERLGLLTREHVSSSCKEAEASALKWLLSKSGPGTNPGRFLVILPAQSRRRPILTPELPEGWVRKSSGLRWIIAVRPTTSAGLKRFV